MADANTGKLPVLECVRSAWMFFIEHWKLFIPAAVIVALLSQLGLLLGAISTPTTQPTVLDLYLGDMLIAFPAFLAGVAFTAVILRKIVRNEFVGRTGLAAGADELRLLGAMAALLCMFVPIIVLVGIVLSMTVFSRIQATPAEWQVLLADPDAMSNAIVQAIGEQGSAALSLFIMVLFALAIVIFTRLQMVSAATIGERRIVLLQTWSWSRGNVLRMLGAIILTGLPIMVVNNLILAAGASIVSASGGATAGAVPFFLVTTIIAFISAMTSIPATALGAIFYKGLRPADFKAK